MVISESSGRWDGDVTASISTAALLAGALLAAIASGYNWPTPSQRYQVGAYICSATAVSSLFATRTGHYLVMSGIFGIGAGLVLINAR